MYQVDDRDRVMELTDIPQMSVGAPCPIVLSNENVTLVAYYPQNKLPYWDGRASSVGKDVVILCFESCLASLFGPPNDEAFSGHPLASRGLERYSAAVVEESSWIRALSDMNSVHPNHRPDQLFGFKHFILAFHDSVFECVAKGFSIEAGIGSVEGVVPRMLELLNG